MPGREVKRFGLTQIWCSEEPLVDIVLVHGLNGHPNDTWTSESGVFWPADLLPQLGPKYVRVLTYGYNASIASFTDSVSHDGILQHAETLSGDLSANRNLRNCTDRPIIFVCHSLGGLVVKRALLYCRSIAHENIEHLRSIYVSTYGILFLGTPHNGSDMAKWGHLLQSICGAVFPKKFMDSSPNLIKALKTNNELLQNINSEFADVASRFHIYFFHETRATRVGTTREMIVDEHSAAPYIEGVERMGIEADHGRMCKFDSESAPGYEAVAEALLRYSRDAPSRIADRWIEEKKRRLLERQTRANEIFNSPNLSSSNMGGGLSVSVPDMNNIGSSTVSLSLSPIDGRRSSGQDLTRSVDLSLIAYQKKPFFVAPPGFHPNAIFVGMRRELEILHVRLFKAKKRPLRLMAVLITGVTGSGKSHLARQYVWTHLNDYPGGIFWVDAKTFQSTCTCFWDIAVEVGLIDGKTELGGSESKASAKHVDAVRHWFQAREEWLLIFDGLCFDKDEDISRLKQFLPNNKNCAIIYTSIDKTLARKQRLFEPYCLTVPPLREEDGCKLLFKDMSIKRPTPQQLQKAKELVRHFEGLPLAIHAISHRLSAASKPIEKYRVNSHLTDQKLAEPFLGIMNDLYRMRRFEALYLINLLSYLGHRIPVGLIVLGRHALEDWDVQILTSSRPGERPDLDTTLQTLIKYGLIERTTHPYDFWHPKHSPQQSSESVDLKRVVIAADSSESPTESSSQDGFFAAYQNVSVIDIIKIHSVVQRFCRDELKIMDEETKAMGTRDRSTAGFYDSWLVVATRVFCKAYEKAKSKMDMQDVGLSKDYREFSTHGCVLLELYPKKLTSKSPQLVYEARSDLENTMSSIERQIDAIPPHTSQEEIRNNRSVFDRYSSPSSSIPDSDEGPSRQTTWDSRVFEPLAAEALNKDRPRPPKSVNLGPFPPHIYRYTAGEAGYETDTEGFNATVRSSPAISQISEDTERPRSSQASTPTNLVDDFEWNVVNASRFVRPESKTKPILPILTKSSAHRIPEPPGSHSPAQRALETLQRGRARLEEPPTLSLKENSRNYANVAVEHSEGMTIPGKELSLSKNSFASRLQGQPSYESLYSDGSYTQRQSWIRPTDKGALDRCRRPAQNEQSHLEARITRKLKALDLNSAPVSRYHSRHSTAAIPADLSASSPSISPSSHVGQIVGNLGTGDEGGVGNQRVSTSKPGSNLSPLAHPSAIMPGTSPPSIITDLPSGYLTEPVQQESVSHAETMPGEKPQHSQPADSIVSGTGSWMDGVSAIFRKHGR